MLNIFYQYLLHLSVWNLFIWMNILFSKKRNYPIQPIQEIQACFLIHFWNEWLQKILKVNLRNNLYNALQAGPSYMYLLSCRLLVSTYPTQKGNSNKTDLTQSSTVIYFCHGLEPKLQNHLAHTLARCSAFWVLLPWAGWPYVNRGTLRN